MCYEHASDIRTSFGDSKAGKTGDEAAVGYSLQFTGYSAIMSVRLGDSRIRRSSCATRGRRLSVAFGCACCNVCVCVCLMCLMCV
jgi:hypothetical protein